MATRKHGKSCDCARCVEKKEKYDLTETDKYEFSIDTKEIVRPILGKKKIKVLTIKILSEGRFVSFLIKKILY